jgi:hypothetical protein
MAHTEGPWWACPPDADGGNWEVEDGYGHTATVYGDDEPAAANARLVAAAPDLLAACHKLIDSDAAVEEDERKHQLLLAKLLAARAVAKAEGVTMEGTNGKERSLD